jgi:hypothetical protein
MLPLNRTNKNEKLVTILTIATNNWHSKQIILVLKLKKKTEKISRNGNTTATTTVSATKWVT